MSEIILKTLITFLIIYALIDIVTRVMQWITRSETHKSELFVVVKVKNQESNLEYIVRSIIWRFLNQNGGNRVPYILIVDMGSDDGTDEIAQKLCNDYEFIYYATEDRYNEMKKQFLI